MKRVWLAAIAAAVFSLQMAAGELQRDVSSSQQVDSMLVAIGRDIFLINAQGHTQWQHRLETRAIITDVVWHPTEKYYTVATDNGEVSTWETASGRVVSSSKLDIGAHATAVKVGWTSEDSLGASVRGVN